MMNLNSASCFPIIERSSNTFTTHKRSPTPTTERQRERERDTGGGTRTGTDPGRVEDWDTESGPRPGAPEDRLAADEDVDVPHVRIRFGPGFARGTGAFSDTPGQRSIQRSSHRFAAASYLLGSRRFCRRHDSQHLVA